MTAYIDLNIFDRLEKLDKLEQSEKVLYRTLFSLLTDKHLLTAYSNALLTFLVFNLFISLYRLGMRPRPPRRVNQLFG
jgi:hypothetical protein